jgi:hypothetical protein
MSSFRPVRSSAMRDIEDSSFALYDFCDAAPKFLPLPGGDVHRIAREALGGARSMGDLEKP